MIAIIDRQRQAYGEKVLRMDGYIFHLPGGGPISEKRVQNEIDRIVKLINATGIVFERFTPHNQGGGNGADCKSILRAGKLVF